MEHLYNHEFYADRNKNTRYAAGKVMDILSEYITFQSVIDAGGGVGTWLKAAQKKFGLRPQNVLLLEGDYVESKLLQIPKKQWIPCNLEERFCVERRFDLAISLEVAEHLSESRAESFCEDLTRLSDVILFSAAVPFQSGNGHINEQRLSYWVRLFEKCQYEAFDIVRPLIQHDTGIPSWYRQNIVVFVKKGTGEYSAFISKHKNLPPLDAICYDIYLRTEKDLHMLSFYNRYMSINRAVCGFFKKIKNFMRWER